MEQVETELEDMGQILERLEERGNRVRKKGMQIISKLLGSNLWIFLTLLADIYFKVVFR